MGKSGKVIEGKRGWGVGTEGFGGWAPGENDIVLQWVSPKSNKTLSCNTLLFRGKVLLIRLYLNHSQSRHMHKKDQSVK